MENAVVYFENGDFKVIDQKPYEFKKDLKTILELSKKNDQRRETCSGRISDDKVNKNIRDRIYNDPVRKT